VLYFVYPELALGYMLFSFLAALGVLQIVSTHERLAGLALVHQSRHRAAGYVLGAALVISGTAWYFVSQWWRILTPGPAGSELAVLIIPSAGGALLFTAAMAALRQRKEAQPQLALENAHKQTVTIGHATGDLYLPSNPGKPIPAVTVVAGPDSHGHASLVTLAQEFVQHGMAVLLLTTERESYTYPEILALLPAAMSGLGKHPEIDPQRIGAVGYDLGGDLVLRAASADPQLKALVALAPILWEQPCGLDLLREMSYPEAWRWAADRQRTRLRSELNALEHVRRIAPRPAMLLYGARDSLVHNPCIGVDGGNAALPQPLLACEASIAIRSIPEAGHRDLLDHTETRNAVLQWFEEHL
jgi:hypothetical protein